MGDGNLRGALPRGLAICPDYPTALPGRLQSGLLRSERLRWEGRWVVASGRQVQAGLKLVKMEVASTLKRAPGILGAMAPDTLF